MTSSTPAPPGSHSRAYVYYAIAMVFLLSVFNVVDRTIISLLVPGIKADLELSDLQLGLLLGPSFSVVHFLAVLPAAWWADRTSRRTVMAAGLFVWSGMTALGGAATNFAQLFATRMGVGIGEAAGSPAAASLLSDTAPEEMRARALSSLTIGALVGIGVGMLLGGWISQHYGWRAALIAIGLPGVLVAVLIRLTLREPARKAGAKATPFEATRTLFAYRSFSWVVLAASIAAVGSYGRNLWEPAFLHRVYGYSYLDVGITYFLIAAVPSAFGAIIGSVVADRMGARDPRWHVRVCALGNLVASPLIVALLLWPEDDVVQIAGQAIPVAFLYGALGAVFAGFFSPPVATLVQGLAGPRMRALAHAIWTMIFNLVGMGAGPLLVGSLSDAWSSSYGDHAVRWALAASTITLPISSVFFLVAGRTLRADLAHARARD